MHITGLQQREPLFSVGLPSASATAAAAAASIVRAEGTRPHRGRVIAVGLGPPVVLYTDSLVSLQCKKVLRSATVRV